MYHVGKNCQAAIARLFGQYNVLAQTIKKIEQVFNTVYKKFWQRLEKLLCWVGLVHG